MNIVVKCKRDFPALAGELVDVFGLPPFENKGGTHLQLALDRIEQIRSYLPSEYEKATLVLGAVAYELQQKSSNRTILFELQTKVFDAMNEIVAEEQSRVTVTQAGHFLFKIDRSALAAEGTGMALHCDQALDRFHENEIITAGELTRRIHKSRPSLNYYMKKGLIPLKLETRKLAFNLEHAKAFFLARGIKFHDQTKETLAD